MNRSHRLIPICTALLAALIVLTACHAPQPQTQTLTGYQTIELQRVAVMPFMAGLEKSGADIRETHPLDCTVARFCGDVNELNLGAEATLTRVMQAALKRRLDYRVAPQPVAARIFDTMPLDREQDTPRQIARRFGRLMGADHVVLGKVWRYRDHRDDQGASVGFVVYLVEVANGRRVWRGRFDRTQNQLLDDLRESPAFFASGARWLSAEEFSRIGIDQMLASFPRVAE